MKTIIGFCLAGSCVCRKSDTAPFCGIGTAANGTSMLTSVEGVKEPESTPTYAVGPRKSASPRVSRGGGKPPHGRRREVIHRPPPQEAAFCRGPPRGRAVSCGRPAWRERESSLKALVSAGDVTEAH